MTKRGRGVGREQVVEPRRALAGGDAEQGVGPGRQPLEGSSEGAGVQRCHGSPHLEAPGEEVLAVALCDAKRLLPRQVRQQRGHCLGQESPTTESAVSRGGSVSPRKSKATCIASRMRC